MKLLERRCASHLGNSFLDAVGATCSVHQWLLIIEDKFVHFIRMKKEQSMAFPH